MTDSADTVTLDPARRAIVGATLRRIPVGRNDPTTVLEDRDGRTTLTRVRVTPRGTTTLRISVTADRVTVDAEGDAPANATRTWTSLTGLDDDVADFVAHHRVVAEAARRLPALRLFATASVYEELIAAVLGQRITGVEAAAQWARLCRTHGRVDPVSGLRSAPMPSTLAEMPYHRFHPLGIEKRRADAIRAVASHFASRPSRLVGADTLRSELTTAAHGGPSPLPGVGQWTAAVAVARTWADPDALAVGDWHLKNLVAHALAGRPRGTDEEMVRLLEPYRGHRHRVTVLLAAAGLHAPRFGPRRRIVHVGRI